jgi:protein-S-isoprenylcysteine O-methyltransferase Ste14
VTPRAALVVGWTLWMLSWLVAAFWRDRSVKRASGGSESIHRLLTIAGSILLFAGHPYRASAESWRAERGPAWALVGVAWIGFVITWWARIHLGRLWSVGVTRTADHRVVDTGPYAFVRHPIYTGLILAIIATAAMVGTPLQWLGGALVVLGLYVKARAEEEFLREQLGAESYADYARRVPMLVPFWRPRSR